jgi:sucrose-6-phosphatase
VPTLLLVCDLDRTLLPNGSHPESPGARAFFKRFVTHHEVILAFASGRDRRLVEQAITEFDLPTPTYVISDVGTTVYHVTDETWQSLAPWRERMARDWAGQTAESIAQLLEPLHYLRLQEAEKQNSFKLSYYCESDIDINTLEADLRRCMGGQTLRYQYVFSIDEQSNTGLVDIIPEGGGKAHAIEFLVRHLALDNNQVVFAGDSGNDLEGLISPIPSVLVANALPSIRAQALEGAQRNGTLDALYFAQSGVLGMNGNYAAGVLEGVAHFHPLLFDTFRNNESTRSYMQTS